MTIYQAFPDVITENKGIFEFFVTAPWYDIVPSDSLNIEYFINRSYPKLCAPIVRRFADMHDGKLLDEDRERIAKIFYDRNKDSLTRLWDAITAEYDPINNYDMRETTSRTVTTSDNTDMKTESKTEDKVDDSFTEDSRTYTPGFNSVSPNDDCLSTKSYDGSVRHTSDLTTGDTDSNIRKDGIEIEGGSTRRFGNIGVTTNQKLITEEIMLRRKSFFDEVFSRLDDYLTLPIYDICKVGCCFD